MNLLRSSALLVIVLLTSSNAFGYDSLLTDILPSSPAVSIASCTITEDKGRIHHKLEILDRSSDALPVPRRGATCAQYINDLNRLGAKVQVQSVPCEAILPGTERYRLCIAVIASTLFPIW